MTSQQQYIKEELELLDVLDTFPQLRDTFKHLGIPLTNVREGITIKKYFQDRFMEDAEIKILINKLNYEITSMQKKTKEQETRKVEKAKQEYEEEEFSEEEED